MSGSAVVATLRHELGDEVVRTGAAIEPVHCTDWTGHGAARPLAVLLPRDTAEVSRALRICHAHGQPVVPQGGMTGMAGGSVPRAQDVCVSLRRMAGVEEVDPAAATLTVRAGTILQVAQDAAREAGLLLALDLGARGSCQIGGNIATNAGGNNVVRYGMMREQVLGLEVVLADGTVLSALNKMVKNNAGYDLKHWFIGSEGTLGIITRAVLRLHPLPQGVQTALCALPGYEEAVRLLRRLQAQAGAVSAYEVMWPSFYRLGASWLHGGRAPLPEGYPLYALAEVDTGPGPDGAARLEALLAAAAEEGVLLDAAIAQSHADARGMWAVREATAEFPARLDPINFDISLPIGAIGHFVAGCQAAFAGRWPGVGDVYFGHVGDSNLHLTVDARSAPGITAQEVEAMVYGRLRECGGSISAEHGIGTHKREWLSCSRSPQEIAAMRAIKAALDPCGILNPGKVLA